MLLNEIESYWTNRAEGYSKVNKHELAGVQRMLWGNLIEANMPEQLKNVKNKKEINVLDIGTGPGFFSILLAERGYNVSAVDYTEEMLVKAKDNAGIFKDEIDFRRMDAQNLDFDNNQFDLIVTRNLTWVLEDPEKAYKEWFRVLKPGGKLLNFDANWYCHLSDETKKREFALTRENLKREGIYDYFVDGEGIDNDWMDDIARQMPLTYIVRPTWDICKLKDIGFREATAETEKVFEVLTPEEKENYKNSPMFMIEAVK
ncbi:MAG: methyltransferase domain-containing protein [Lachnospiraceae bacterium]|nr:methyltransferase domain-containing protein [Lachnospiraceae bacterium]